MSESSPVQPRRIAVVAVHGVGDQTRHETAYSVANLLLNLSRRDDVCYTPFTERELRIATRRVAVHRDGPDRPAGGAVRWPAFLRSPFNERGRHVRRGLTGQIVEPPEHGFMRDQLRDYEGEGPDATYETVRLEGARLNADGSPTAEVHLYEMYWADLSRLGTGFFRIFSELYQLLFHLGSLGRLTVDFACLAYKNPSWWRRFSRVQAGAVWWLTLPVPIFNLLILAVVLTPLPGNLPENYQPYVALGLPLLALIVGAGFLFLRLPRLPKLLWAVPPLALAALLAFLGLASSGGHKPPFHERYQSLLAFEWVALAAVLVAGLLAAYDRRRPGAGLFGVFTGGASLIFLIAMLARVPSTHAGVTGATLRTVEILYAALSISWLVCDALGLLLLGVALLAVRQAAPDRRARQAAGTALLSLSLSATLFTLVTLALWSAMERVATRFMPARILYTPFFSTAATSGPTAARTFVHELITVSATPTFTAGLGLLVVAVLMAVWALAPVVWAEVRPPRGMDKSSTRLGEWLTKGLAMLVGAGMLLYGIAFLIFPAGFLYSLVTPSSTYPQLAKATEGVLQAMGALLATSLIAFRGRLDRLALGFRPVLDTALDVDSWLREHPRDANPRARICARYASLLRYLCRWTDPRDTGQYQAIIIVAHSQGTVITADLLRFLRYERDRWPADRPDPDSALAMLGQEIPVYLFTFGSPLRQLYNTRFPHLYDWVLHRPAQNNQLEHWKTWQADDIIPAGRAPDPDALGVKQWVNAYRSGDYVGRALWRPERCDYQWLAPPEDRETLPWDPTVDRPQNVSRDVAGRRREFCVGAGAHTHYLDVTAPEIAVELDRLIREASQ